MDRVHLRLAMWDYDFVLPLATGDIIPEGIELSLIRQSDALDLVLGDPDIDGGEASFSRYLRGIAGGDRSFVGLPVFLMREFRHRCFIVRRDSALADVTELTGKRVGTDVWGASGNVWTRAILRERGVPIERIAWMVAPVNPGDPPVPVAGLPRCVQAAPPGRSLSDLLADGEIEALMCSLPPAEFCTPESRMRRLYVDYRKAEREYYLRTHLFPAHHLLVLRRAVVDRHPWAVRSLYTAFTQARERSERSHWVLHESSPWILPDLEEQQALMGRDFQPYGYRANQPMVAAFCAEQFAQGLIREPVNPDLLFAEFEQLMG